MRAGYADKEVCPRCNGTGYKVYKAKGYEYSVLCTYVGFKKTGQLSLVPITQVLRRRKEKGNRWHSKN